MSAGVQLHPQTLRHLGWELAARNIGLIMAPALTDIAGPRIHTQQVAGLPLIHVTTPTLEGGQRVAKRLFDIMVSGVLILLAAPAMLVIAAVLLGSTAADQCSLDKTAWAWRASTSKCSSSGPWLWMRRRDLSELQKQNEGSGLLFKIEERSSNHSCRRIPPTSISLDELPQLFNILGGSMSLVGPRPPLPREVEAYEHDVRRRLTGQTRADTDFGKSADVQTCLGRIPFVWISTTSKIGRLLATS